MRGKATHRSTTDPTARLARKGKEAKLCFGAHVPMDNRNGLVVDVRLTPATETVERNRHWLETTTAGYNLVRLVKLLPLAA